MSVKISSDRQVIFWLRKLTIDHIDDGNLSRFAILHGQPIVKNNLEI